MAKRVFIGSSSESLPVARAVQSELRSYKSFSPVIWNQEIIRAGRYTIPELIKELTRSDYATVSFVFFDLILLFSLSLCIYSPTTVQLFDLCTLPIWGVLG